MKQQPLGRIARGGAVVGFSLLLNTAAQAAINISMQATQNMSCSGGVCTATAQKAYLNVNDVTNMLAAGDLKVVSGAGAEDIHIQAPFSWTSTTRLTLDAQRSIEFEKPVTVAGTGALTLITNDGDTGGDYWFDEGASVSFWDTSSSLLINGQSFTLVKDIKTLAAHIAANPSGNYALASNYDASADSFSDFPVPTAFPGIFEGLGNTISNLSIEPSGYNSAAFFEEASGTLRDLDLQNVRAGTAGGDAASLLLIDDAATIIGRNATGTVRSEFRAGGLVADSGLAGGVIIRSHAAVEVSDIDEYGAHPPAGGLLGRSMGIDISLSSASGEVSGYAAGGLVGEMKGGSISQSFASGQVEGGAYAGGLVGDVGGGSIQDSYATGRVHSERSGTRGGLAATFDHSTTRSSYSTGAVKRRSQVLNGKMGGFVGVAGGGDDLKWDYWDTNTSGMTQGYGTCNGDNCAGRITGLQTSEFLSGLPRGFDHQIWRESPSINHGYPYLRANPPPNNAPAKHRAKSSPQSHDRNPAGA